MTVNVAHLEQAVSRASEMAKARDDLAREIEVIRREIEAEVRDLVSFSAAVDSKVAERFNLSKSEIGKRPLTSQEQQKAAMMQQKVRNLNARGRHLMKLVDFEIRNAESAKSQLEPDGQRGVARAIMDLKKLRSELEKMSFRASVVERALSRARNRDDLEMILLKGAGVAALLSIVATVAGATVLGGVLAIPALLAFGVSRIVDEAKKLMEA